VLQVQGGEIGGHGKSVKLRRCLFAFGAAISAVMSFHPALAGTPDPGSSCSRPKSWLSASANFLGGHTDFNTIFVGSNFYKINGFRISRESDFVQYLGMLRRARPDPHRSMGYVFLLSGRGASCKRFLAAAMKLEKSYECRSSKACIWGYAKGKYARPAGVPAPPKKD
jgi:hypothetical protein